MQNQIQGPAIQFDTKMQHVLLSVFFVIITIISVLAVQQMCEFSVATTLSAMLSASAFICILSMRDYHKLNVAPTWNPLDHVPYAKIIRKQEKQEIILKNLTASAWHNHCMRLNFEIRAFDLNYLVAYFNGEPVGMLDEHKNWLLFGEGEILV